jgi:hypothetical protein
METKPLLTPAERETEAAAERLSAQVHAALAAVAIRANNDTEDLESYADRLERAARDLAAALRELARERRTTHDER